MEGRKDQLVDEGIMETASVAPPEPQEQQGQSDTRHDGRQEGCDSADEQPSSFQPEPQTPPPPD